MCNKVKDKIHDLDKTDAIYHIKCKPHQENYVGETERVLRARMYEHKVIDPDRSQNGDHNMIIRRR